MRVYITLLGRSLHAIINSFWATVKIHEYHPDKMYIIHEVHEGDFEYIQSTIENNLDTIMSEYGFSSEIVFVDVDFLDFQGCMDRINEILEMHKDDSIAIDITSSRKYMAIAAVLSGWESVEHIFFLHTEMVKYREMPFMMRPMLYQHPLDLKNFSKTRGRVWQI